MVCKDHAILSNFLFVKDKTSRAINVDKVLLGNSTITALEPDLGLEGSAFPPLPCPRISQKSLSMAACWEPCGLVPRDACTSTCSLGCDGVHQG